MELTRRGWARSAIARAAGVSWNTVARWQRRSAGEEGYAGEGRPDAPAGAPERVRG
jgi:transposase